MSNTQKTLIGTIPIAEMQQEVDNLVNETKQNYPAIECFETFNDPESRSELTLDSSNKIVSYRKDDGTLVENVGIETKNIYVDDSSLKNATIDDVNIKNGSALFNSLNLTEDGMSDFKQALKDAGFKGGSGDWSDYISNDGDNPLHLPIPRLAFINIISDFDLTKLSKKGYNASSREGVNYNIPTQVEYWDNEGNYFKKWTLMSGQGSSTMALLKKSIALDFFDSEAGGDALKIKFGDWVPQDSFHFKAFYNDFFKGISFCSYQIAEEVAKTRNVLEDVQWKRALYPKYNFDSNVLANAQIDDMSLQLGTEAKCQPDGFPCIIYQNGNFYGMYVLGIKKNRDNYLQKKNKSNHIHLDGEMYAASKHLFAGHIDWTAFEIRNPKNLVYAVAQTDIETGETTYKYDADIAQADIAGNSNGSISYDEWDDESIYVIGKIVKRTTDIDGKSHLFLNTIEGNDKEPVITYNQDKDEWYNKDGDPDFKNKTKCGWLNVTDTVKVKESIIKAGETLSFIEDSASIELIEGYLAPKWYEGQYDSSISYKKGALVSDNKHIYLSLNDNNVNHPLDGEYWFDYTTRLQLVKKDIERYFDVPGLIDYELIQCAVADVDAIWNNCQWVTWDGNKWFACEYDKDDTFGSLVSCSGVREQGGWSLSLWSTSAVDDESPFGLVRKYYFMEAAERWKELVDKGIFTTEHFINVIIDWMKRFGSDFYKKEYEKWPDSGCAKDTNINTTYWKYVSCDYKSSVSIYSASKQYTVGDRCSKVSVDPDWRHIFECVSNCQNQNPTTGSLGYRGNIGQLYEFIKGNFEKENSFFENILNNNN